MSKVYIQNLITNSCSALLSAFVMTASMRSLGSTTAVAVGTLNFAAAASGSLVRLLTSDRTNSEGYCGSLARLGSNASKGNIPSRLV